MIVWIFGNDTDIVHWKPSPTTRGTSDILTTCVTTLLLCAWTAVHLNVPAPGSRLASTGRKAGWLILALLAPEVVAYTAWEQRRRAKKAMQRVNLSRGFYKSPPPWHKRASSGISRLCSRLFLSFRGSKVLPRQPTLESQKGRSKEQWTMSHGFYAVMGGFALQMPLELPESEEFRPRDSRKEFLFIHDKTLHLLLRQESDGEDILNFSLEEIQSKSRANGSTKGIACIQATWFVAQCLTRFVNHTPISLLELNTFGHAICALLIYLLWWEKPFDVDYPTVIRDRRLWNLYAYSLFRSRPSETTAETRRIYGKAVNAPSIVPVVDTIPFNGERMLVTAWNCYNTPDHEDLRLSESSSECNGIILRSGENVPKTTWRIRYISDFNSCPPPTPPPTHFGPSFVRCLEQREYKPEPKKVTFQDIEFPLKVKLMPQDLLRWQMAFRATNKPANLDDDDSRYMKWDEAFSTRRSNWPRPNLFQMDPRENAAFCLAALIYGGLHALAWSSPFESRTQRLLWQVSSCVVMTALPSVLTAYHLLMTIADKAHYRFASPDTFDPTPPWKDTYHSVLVGGVGNSIFLVYVLARAYLVIESFLHLAHLPAAVYEVPSWSVYFPHIS